MRWCGIDIGLVNFSYCIITDAQTIEAWENVNVVTQLGYKSCRQINLGQLDSIAGYIIHHILKPVENRIDHIVIEGQPKHSKFKCLSYVLQSRLNALRTSTQLISVAIIGASTKYCKPWLQRYNLTKQKVYKNRKKLSIQLCTLMLGSKFNNQESKKRDDLADSYLLARYAYEFRPHCIMKQGRSCSRSLQTTEAPMNPQTTVDPTTLMETTTVTTVPSCSECTVISS